MATSSERTWRGAVSGIARALRRRCPRCGAIGVWASWTRFKDRCPSCGLALDRGESDHFYGAYMLNFMAAELALDLFFRPRPGESIR